MNMFKKTEEKNKVDEVLSKMGLTHEEAKVFFMHFAKDFLTDCEIELNVNNNTKHDYYDSKSENVKISIAITYNDETLMKGNTEFDINLN